MNKVIYVVVYPEHEIHAYDNEQEAVEDVRRADSEGTTICYRFNIANLNVTEPVCASVDGEFEMISE